MLADSNAIERDVLQLRGLVERMDAAAFLPLHATEVTDQMLGRRWIDYVDLASDIVDELVTRNIVCRNGSRLSNTSYESGRNVRVSKEIGLWLGVSLRMWRDVGISPLWWYIDERTYYGIGKRLPQVVRLFPEVQNRGDHLYIPIRLKTGVERIRVIEGAVEQMKQVANALQNEFPIV